MLGCTQCRAVIYREVFVAHLMRAHRTSPTTKAWVRLTSLVARGVPVRTGI